MVLQLTNCWRQDHEILSTPVVFLFLLGQIVFVAFRVTGDATGHRHRRNGKAHRSRQRQRLQQLRCKVPCFKLHRNPLHLCDRVHDPSLSAIRLPRESGRALALIVVLLLSVAFLFLPMFIPLSTPELYLTSQQMKCLRKTRAHASACPHMAISCCSEHVWRRRPCILRARCPQPSALKSPPERRKSTFDAPSRMAVVKRRISACVASEPLSSTLRSILRYTRGVRDSSNMIL